jgi:hypothetical protein
MLVRYYTFSCPSCKAQYANKLSPILLGAGRRVCAKCQLAFNDGTHEWPELTRTQKLQYFLPTMPLGFVLGAVLMAGIAVWVARDELGIGFALAGLIILMFAGPWIPYFLLQWRHIPRSKERFERKA